MVALGGLSASGPPIETRELFVPLSLFACFSARSFSAFASESMSLWSATPLLSLGLICFFGLHKIGFHSISLLLVCQRLSHPAASSSYTQLSPSYSQLFHQPLDSCTSQSSMSYFSLPPSLPPLDFSALTDPSIVSYLTSLLSEEDSDAFTSALTGMVEGLDEIEDASSVVALIAASMSEGAVVGSTPYASSHKTNRKQQDQSIPSLISSTLSLPCAFATHLVGLYPPPSSFETREEMAQHVISCSLDGDLDGIRERWEVGEREKEAKKERAIEKENSASRLRPSSSASLDAAAKSQILERYEDQSYSVSGSSLSASALQRKQRKEARRFRKGGGQDAKKGLTVKYR